MVQVGLIELIILVLLQTYILLDTELEGFQKISKILQVKVPPLELALSNQCSRGFHF